jgi:hypothetical protein
MALLDRFIPRPDRRERHEIRVRAPAGLVLDTARGFDMLSIPLVRMIFDLRGRVMGAQAPPPREPRGFVEETLGLGWGILDEQPGRHIVAGAVCQPWLADVKFRSVPPERFAEFAEPDQVKIAWTLEVEALDGGSTRLATETRAVATDAGARAKFLRYWSVAGIGIILIRVLLLPGVRRKAERRWREGGGAERPEAIG